MTEIKYLLIFFEIIMYGIWIVIMRQTIFGYSRFKHFHKQNYVINSMFTRFWDKQWVSLYSSELSSERNLTSNYIIEYTGNRVVFIEKPNSILNEKMVNITYWMESNRYEL